MKNEMCPEIEVPEVLPCRKDYGGEAYHCDVMGITAKAV
jgi:hypothetical protein